MGADRPRAAAQECGRSIRVHWRDVAQGCRAAGLSGADLQDAVQESLLAIVQWARRHPVDVAGRGRSWFVMMGRQGAGRFARQMARDRALVRYLASSSQDAVTGPDPTCGDPLLILVARERREVLQRAWDGLSETQRRIVSWHVLERVSLRQVSRWLCVSRSHVRATLTVALGRLRGALGERGGR